MVYLDGRPPLRPQNGATANGHQKKGGAHQPYRSPVDKNGDNSLNYYWNTSANPYYGTENIYAAHHQPQKPQQHQQVERSVVQQQPTRRQYNPFPLSLPNSTPTAVRRGLPRQGSPGVYQNVPATNGNGGAGTGLPRQPASAQMNGGSGRHSGGVAPYGPKATTSPSNGQTYENKYTNGNGVAANGNKRRESPAVWTTTAHPDVLAPITQIRRSTPPKFLSEKSHSVQNRSKPRWGRWMQSLCCCMSTQQEIEPVKGAPVSPHHSSLSSPHSHPPPPPPVVSSPPPNPGLLITQVNKDGSTTTAPPPQGQKQSNDREDKAVANGTSNYAQQALHSIIEPFKPPIEKLLLPPLRPQDAKKKCLIIDLDETLVHSSFKPVKNPDFVIPVEIDGVVHQVYVLKRPFVDEFLAHVGDKYECILFTASLAKYADPVADLLDKKGVFRGRLFREACVFHKGNYVKDLARLGRDLNKVLIMDNSPASYAFHPENAIAVQTWFDDPHDVELLDVLPLLDRLAEVDSVYTVLRQSESPSPDRSFSS